MKTDLKKSLDSYRAKHGVVRILDVPVLQYVMLGGHGDPNVSGDVAYAMDGLYDPAPAGPACLAGAQRRRAGQVRLR